MLIQNLEIVDWCGLSAQNTCKSEWIDWSKGPAKLSGIFEGPTPLVPHKTQRRASRLTKITLQTAHSLTQQHSPDAAFFCSQHGELERTVTLLRQITDNEPLSPSAFSQSVHNTAAGLFSIDKKLRIPISSICAGEHTVSMALLEASSFLRRSPNSKALLIYSDLTLPELYQKPDQTLYGDVAFGCILGLKGSKEDAFHRENLEFHQNLKAIQQLILSTERSTT